MARDENRLRYQVLDTEGVVRERLDWPLRLPAPANDIPLAAGINLNDDRTDMIRDWSISGIAAATRGHAQTLMAWWNDEWLLACWLGLIGPEQQFAVTLSPMAGRSAGLWRGPNIAVGAPFSIQVAFCPDLGPGGILWRWGDASSWSSMIGASAWGIERMPDTMWRSIGQTKSSQDDEPFRGSDLRIVPLT